MINNFGVSNNNLCIVDTHGVTSPTISDKIFLPNIFDVLIVHLSEKSILDNDQTVQKLCQILERIPGESRVFLFVRDSIKVNNRNDWLCNEEAFRQNFPSSLLLKVVGRLKPCLIPNLTEKRIAEFYSKSLRDYICQEIRTVKTTSNFIQVFKESDRIRINAIQSAYMPLIDHIVKAVRNKGINETGYFSLYPIYFERSLVQNELGKLVYFANNSTRVNELRKNDVILKTKLEKNACNYALLPSENKAKVPEIFVNTCLNSDDLILLLNCLAKRINICFQKELSDKLKEKETLLALIRNELRNNNQSRVIKKTLINN